MRIVGSIGCQLQTVTFSSHPLQLHIIFPKTQEATATQRSTQNNITGTKAEGDTEGERSDTADPFQTGMLTDQDILAGGVDALRNDNLLQIVATHSNNGILEKLNGGQGQPVITGQQLRTRLTHAITNIAKRDGRPREDVKAEVDAARLASGVKKRRYAASTTALAVAIGETQQADGGGCGSAETSGIHRVETVDSAPEYDALTDLAHREEQLRQMEVHGLFEDTSPIMDDDVLQLAGKFTICEIVDHLNVGRKHPVFDAKVITRRIDAAVVNMALRKGKSAQAVKAELEATKIAEGVTKRARVQAKAKRRAAALLS
ncbi:hypothetical protein LTR85_004391 [Meristemomyces frigidus]|nr:hypothetical protein LTR85_004391 [Meristemomyces frigidus]